MNKLFSVILCILLILSLASCSSSKYAGNVSSPEWSQEADGWGGSAVSKDEASTSLSSTDLTGRKQIYRYDLSLNTSSFDELIQTIRTDCAALGGFVEEVSLDSNRSYRYTTMIVRVPTASAESFVAGMEGRAVVTSKSQTTEDVTLEYVDVETRLNNLEAERQALAALMERADSVEELISIQSRLSEVQYELESYTARKNKIDELVGLSTVTFRIREVEREEMVAEEKSLWGKISSGFMNNLLGVGEFFRDLFAGLIISLPILAVPVVLTLVIFFAVRRKLRKKKKDQTQTQTKG